MPSTRCRYHKAISEQEHRREKVGSRSPASESIAGSGNSSRLIVRRQKADQHAAPFYWRAALKVPYKLVLAVGSIMAAACKLWHTSCALNSAVCNAVASASFVI